ncbi:MAG: HAMP domain-containing protein [Anaerolineales bacterium]|nr:HAMP domain-containing protein [Anaerolineales bacterium]
MLAWFLLLALIPLGAVMIFVQRQVNQTVLDVELQAVVREARLHAAESAHHPDAFEEHTQIFQGTDEDAFILRTDGTYQAHTDRQKVGAAADTDFAPDILQAFFSSDSGSLDNSAAGKIIGYAAIPGQNSAMVIVKNNQAVQDTLNTLSRSIFLQLSVILLLTSIVSGVAILAVITPLRQLANFADRVGSGDLDATLDQSDLEGEIAVLAGSLTGMTARLRDLIANLESKVKERTRDLEIAAQELKRTDLMKSQFLASMSHELRTPLNSIINFTQLIAMGVAGPVTDEQITMLNTSLSSSRHLLQLINDVLDISKIQAGKLSLYIEEAVNLNDEIKAVVEMAEPLLQKQNAGLEQPIQFIQDIDHDLPLTACDRRRTRQVLLNLLSNAIKFTEQGSITLSAKKRGEEFIFAVMDTGPGVPQDLQARIFEPFVQAADDIKHTQGTGLGLPISRSLVEAHGGELWVESKMGEGTTFFFTLPFRPPKTQ